MQQHKPIGKWISILGRYHQAQMARLLEPYGIGLGQYPFVLEVCTNPGIRQDSLGVRLMLNKSSVARAVSALEKSGYLLRKVDPADKRAYQIFPTAKAMDCRDTIVNTSRGLAEEMTAGFTQQEKDQLNLLMERIGQNIARTNPGAIPSLLPPEAGSSYEKDDES